MTYFYELIVQFSILKLLVSSNKTSVEYIFSFQRGDIMISFWLFAVMFCLFLGGENPEPIYILVNYVSATYCSAYLDTIT